MRRICLLLTLLAACWAVPATASAAVTVNLPSGPVVKAELAPGASTAAVTWGEPTLSAPGVTITTIPGLPGFPGLGGASCTIPGGPAPLPGFPPVGTPVVSGASFPAGDTVVTCTTIAMCISIGSPDCATGFITGTASFTVHVEASASPVFVQPANITAQAADGATSAVVNYGMPTFTDNVGVTVGPVCAPASGSTFPVGTTTVRCFAADAVRNVAIGSFDVVVAGTTTTPAPSSNPTSTPAEPTNAPAAPKVAPKLTTRIDAIRVLGATVPMSAMCDEACTLTAKATVTCGTTKHVLGAATTKAGANELKTLATKLTRKQRTAVAASLSGRVACTAKVTVSGTDADGMSASKTVATRLVVL